MSGVNHVRRGVRELKRRRQSAYDRMLIRQQRGGGPESMSESKYSRLVVARDSLTSSLRL